MVLYRTIHIVIAYHGSRPGASGFDIVRPANSPPVRPYDPDTLRRQLICLTSELMGSTSEFLWLVLLDLLYSS